MKCYTIDLVDLIVTQNYQQTSVFGDGRISTHADRTRGQRARHAMESRTGTFIVLHALADSSDFGLLGEAKFPKWEIPR